MASNQASTAQRVFRFAPSPNGWLHLGHAYSALMTFQAAQAVNGRFLLRIEDIDTARVQEKYVAAIQDDLRWLGIDWPCPVLRQSERFAAYRQAAETLLAMDLLYRCCATRSEIAIAAETQDSGRDPDGAPLYPGRGCVLSESEQERRLADGAPYALRIDMEKACRRATEMLAGKALTFRETLPGATDRRVTAAPARWGDAVIVRKDVPTSYHLSVVVDDAFQGVTDVTRGRDLYPATDIQRLLQVLLQLPQPVYSHHALVLDSDGNKLSKSNDATSLQEFRIRGINTESLLSIIHQHLDSSKS